MYAVKAIFCAATDALRPTRASIIAVQRGFAIPRIGQATILWELTAAAVASVITASANATLAKAFFAMINAYRPKQTANIVEPRGCATIRIATATIIKALHVVPAVTAIMANANAIKGIGVPTPKETVSA